MKKSWTGLCKYGGIILEMSKPGISLFSTLCAACGFLLYAHLPGSALPVLLASLLLISSGSLILNQIQEADIDILMQRTSIRPIPGKRCAPLFALAVSFSFIGSGLAIVYLFLPKTTLFLCILALLLYNVLYTPLKRITPFAAVPGMLIGSLPPLIGWSAAGGPLLSAKIAGLMFFLFMWQLPHYWLHFLTFREDYARSGLPVITGVFTTPQLRRITFVWAAATAVASLLIPLFAYPAGSILPVVTLLFLCGSSAMLLKKEAERQYRTAFLLLNIYGVSVISLVAFERLARIFI